MRSHRIAGGGRQKGGVGVTTRMGSDPRPMAINTTRCGHAWRRSAPCAPTLMCDNTPEGVDNRDELDARRNARLIELITDARSE